MNCTGAYLRYEFSVSIADQKKKSYFFRFFFAVHSSSSVWVWEIHDPLTNRKAIS